MRNWYPWNVSSFHLSTLLTLIQKHVRQGSIIHTDCWRGYSKLQDNGYEHRTVNHSENFVDPSTGTHTQNIESSWRALKRRVTRGGVMHDALYRHFAEYIWMQNHKEDVFYSFCRAIAKTFKVWLFEIYVIFCWSIVFWINQIEMIMIKGPVHFFHHHGKIVF